MEIRNVIYYNRLVFFKKNYYLPSFNNSYILEKYKLTKKVKIKNFYYKSLSKAFFNICNLDNSNINNFKNKKVIKNDISKIFIKLLLYSNLYLVYLIKNIKLL